MTAPEHSTVTDAAATADDEQSLSPLLRAAIWVAIGALIAAALVCVVWVLIGGQDGIIGRAFLTVVLLASFAGVTILDAHLAPRRPAWFALSSMVVWVILLLVGSVMIWMPERYPWSGAGRFIAFLVIVLIFQLALLHVRLYAKALARRVTTFTQTVAIVTVVLVAALAVLLTLPLMLSEWIVFADIYGRIVVAVAILAAVGTALLPLVNVLFAPRKARPAPAVPAANYGAYEPAALGFGTHGYPAQSYGVQAQATQPYGALAFGAQPSGSQPLAVQPPAPPAPAPVAPEPAVTDGPAVADEPELLPWPNYVDGLTPLPMLPDGSPDWDAYYTGVPAPGAFVFPTPAPQPAPAPEPAPAQEPAPSPADPPAPTDYRSFPPPPPLPPQR